MILILHTCWIPSQDAPVGACCLAAAAAHGWGQSRVRNLNTEPRGTDNNCAALQRRLPLSPSITMQPCTLIFSLLCTGTPRMWVSAPRRRSACCLSPFVKVRATRWEETFSSYTLNVWNLKTSDPLCFSCAPGPSLWVCKMGYNRRAGLLCGFCLNVGVQKTVQVHQGYYEPQPWLSRFLNNWLNCRKKPWAESWCSENWSIQRLDKSMTVFTCDWRPHSLVVCRMFNVKHTLGYSSFALTCICILHRQIFCGCLFP